MRDTQRTATSASQVAFVVQKLRTYLFPGGAFREPEPARSGAEMDTTRDECRAKMISALPPTLLSLIGKDRCRAGTNKLHDFLQCRVLVKNLGFRLLDVMVWRLFPETATALAPNDNNGTPPPAMMRQPRRDEEGSGGDNRDGHGDGNDDGGEEWEEGLGGGGDDDA